MDEVILRAINAWTASPAVAAIAIFLSSPWMLIATTAPVAVILIRKKKWPAILSIALAMGAADAINSQIVKPAVARVRPCRELDGLVLPLKCNVGQSFASGHATVAFAFAITASPVVRFGWWLFPLLAACVAFSRVFLGVHYPSDIGAGAVFGAAIGGLSLYGRIAWERFRAPTRSGRRDHPATSGPASPAP
jgi:undecaprenyl-diphosphatase